MSARIKENRKKREWGKKTKRRNTKAKIIRNKILIRMSRGGGCGRWNMWEAISELNVDGRGKVTNELGYDKEYKRVRDGEKG